MRALTGSLSRSYTGVATKPVSGNHTLRVSSTACLVVVRAAWCFSCVGARRLTVTTSRRLTLDGLCRHVIAVNRVVAPVIFGDQSRERFYVELAILHGQRELVILAEVTH